MATGDVKQGSLRPWQRASASGAGRGPGDHEVICVGYEMVDDRYERIATLGIRQGDKVYVLSSQEILEELALGSRFHVTQDGQTSYLRVEISDEGRPYVRTMADATEANNLSLLPDCRAVDRLGRQHRAQLPVWWWLIPLALLALTAFFVIPHMPPIQVTWATPADITYPAPLSAAQLNATANLPGDFVYEPALATVLHAGKQQLLRVTFHTEPLPSPWRALAIVAGLLALVAALVLALWAWRGWWVDRRLRQEEKQEQARLEHAPKAVKERVRSVEERWQDRDELPKRRPNPWWPFAGLALVVLALGGLLWFYLSHPRSVAAGQAITVLPAQAGLTWAAPAGVTCPVTLAATHLNAVASVPGKIVYDPPAGTALKAGKHPLTAALTPDSADYIGTSLSVSIDVAKGQPVLAWAKPAPIPFGTRLGPAQLNATASVPGDFTYTPNEGTALQVGSYNLVANFQPQDSACWEAGSIGVTAVVATLPWDLNWQQPEAITYPMPLSGRQYTYSLVPPVVGALVPTGSPVYTPTIGTVLPAGQQGLMLTFKPDDSANYNTVTASRTLTVNQGTPVLKWTAPADIAEGTLLGTAQLNARAFDWLDQTVTLSGKFTYQPGEGTTLKAGVGQPLTVEFQPDDKNYRPVTATVKINVGAGPVSPPHLAQFLKNGDFEGGFTVAAPATAVGTHWRHFNNGDYHYGYYDDQWSAVWYNADHSQLVEIGSVTFDPGDRPNRLSGISQTVSGLIPGQSYTLTLHGIIRVNEGDPDTDNLSYVAQWGVATGVALWGDVKSWQVVPWTHVYPYLSAGPVQSYATTFTAQSETLTLFIGLLKKPGRGNTELNLNLDGLSLVGPTYDPGLTMASK